MLPAMKTIAAQDFWMTFKIRILPFIGGTRKPQR
jgi:hypothetical protein